MANVDLDLIISPAYDDGNQQTNAVAGKSQALFRVTRKDALVDGSIDNGGLLALTLDRDINNQQLGDSVYISVQSTANPNDILVGVVSIGFVGGTIAITTDIPFNGVLDYTGFVCVQRSGIMNMTVTFDAAQGVFPTPQLSFDILYSRPTLTFDVHNYAEPIFEQYPLETAFRYTATIAATMTGGDTVAGSALGPHTIDNFRSFLPNGYEYGQNLVGVIPNEFNLGRFCSDFPLTGRFYVGYNPFLWYAWDDVDTAVLLRRTWRGVNNTNLGSVTHAVTLEYGIHAIDLTGLDLTPPAGALDVQFFLTKTTGEQLTEAKRMQISCTNGNPVLLSWQNRLGGVDLWWFDGEQEVSHAFERGQLYQDVSLTSLDVYSREIQRYGSREFIRIRLETNMLDLDTYRGIVKMRQSEFTRILTGYDLEQTVPVLLNASFAPTAYSNKVNHSFFIEVELPQDAEEILDIIEYIPS